MSDDETSQSGSTGSCSQRIRNVLTLEERVEVIRQYDIVPMYSKIAKNFNCSWEQIKSIVTNRQPILEFYEARRDNSKQPNSKFEELRRRKLNFLGHCLYEYIQRAQYYLNADINEELIRTKALEFQNLMDIENFVPNKSWINHFKAAYNITLSNRQIVMTRKPPRSLNLRDIMSYCGKNTTASESNGSQGEKHSPTPVIPSTASQTNSSDNPYLTVEPVSDGQVALISQRKPVDIRSLYRTKTLVAASSQNQATLDEIQLRRKRKINFLEKALFEYISRSQFHHKNKGRLDVDHLREVAINLRDILKIENFFPDRTWFNHFKSHYNFSFSQGVQYRMTLRRAPLSLDLRDIVSYCGRNEQRDQPLGSITLTPKETEPARYVHKSLVEHKPAPADKETNNNNNNKSIEVEDDDDDDCVAIEVPTELIEINDDDDEQDKTNTNDLKRPADPTTESSPLKIQKIESLNPAAEPSFEQNSEASEDGELPRCVQSYEDALRLLKPLEEFALLEENYRAIGLLTQLEKVFKGAAQDGNA